TIGKFLSYRIKTSGGSHCGGKEYVACATRRRRRIPQAGFFIPFCNLYVYIFYIFYEAAGAL
ncbi:MAG TPA: hypothetical protein H9763_04725, partial [Candidatus Eisenbergiella merdigallinarum]|nr:hypothetical protein [Candidatus Eisenbergiella merdigallinarum]